VLFPDNLIYIMITHLVVFRVLPIDTDSNPYLVRPLDISPSQPFYKEVHLIGNRNLGFCLIETTYCNEIIADSLNHGKSLVSRAKSSIPDLIKQKRLPPRPVISGPSERKRKSAFKPFWDCVITETLTQQGIPEMFSGGSVPAESPMQLISRRGPIVEIKPRIFCSGHTMWYTIEFPDKLLFNYDPGSFSKSMYKLDTERIDTEENPSKKPSKPEFWEYDGTRFEASDDFDEEQSMCNQGVYYCDICKRKLKGMSHLFRHVENHDTQTF
ncbi:hypothetical protein CDAR_453231, partial [Caerostris darwini]